VKAAGGLYDYRIIADETLNTPDAIDNTEFRIRIGIKPTRTIEFIMIEFVALRTGSTFTELV
jgi:phage tail sheath protein FI